MDAYVPKHMYLSIKAYYVLYILIHDTLDTVLGI